MNRIGILVAWLAVAAASVSSAGEIGYIEDFALAKDRSVPLKNLIPEWRRARDSDATRLRR